MCYYKKTLILFLLICEYVTINSQLEGPSNDDNITDFFHKIEKMFGLSVDHIFNSDSNYPPIYEDVTFWVISPGESKFTQIFINDRYGVTDRIILTKPIGFLIHGWTDAFKNNEWMDTAARAWSHFNNQSVICVDWGRLANYGYFIASQEHTKFVGKFIAEFIEFLQTLGISLDDVTVAGHSLGGQISGFVGQHLNGFLGQIIALDPAGPLFTNPLDNGIQNRLDISDGKFVQVLYTSCGTLGVQINSGHANYYANGGVSQPGCNEKKISCSHSRAVEYFRSSCNPNNLFIGNLCENHYGCNIGESIVKSVPAIGVNLLNSMTVNKECKNSMDDIGRFGIYTNRKYGNFDLPITNSNESFVH